MAIIKAVHSKASIGNALKYITKAEKTEEKYITGKDCDPFYGLEEMKATKALWNKTGGRQYDHYVQSFAPEENVAPKIAHEIATKWAEEHFKGFECIISTHVDRNHIHSHIIVNSVSFENGKKIHTSAKWLEQAKEYSDNLCREYGLSVTEKGKTFEGNDRIEMTAWSKEKYQFLLKAEKGNVKSYVQDTYNAVMEVKGIATSREDFIQKMTEKGYQTEWKDSRKYITFTNQDGKKVRNSTMQKSFNVDISKQQLMKEFAERQNQQTIVNQQDAYKDLFTTQAQEIGKMLVSCKEKYIINRNRVDESIVKVNTCNDQIQVLNKSIHNLAEMERVYRANNERIMETQERIRKLSIFQAREKKDCQDKLESLQNDQQKIVARINQDHNITPEQFHSKAEEYREKINSLETSKKEFDTNRRESLKYMDNCETMYKATKVISQTQSEEYKAITEEIAKETDIYDFRIRESEHEEILCSIKNIYKANEQTIQQCAEYLDSLKTHNQVSEKESSAEQSEEQEQDYER